MKLFLSYRRSDSQDVAGRLYDHLERRVGRESIFKDVDSIPFGTNFTTTIVKAIEQTDIVLALIGPAWLSARDAKGKRLANSADPVRIEIETAFNKSLLVVPVLIGDASMPAGKDLPRSLRKLVDLNAAKLRPDPDFNKDVAKLAQQLKLPEPSTESAPNKVKSLHVTCSAPDKKNLLFRYTLLSGSPEAIVPIIEKRVTQEALTAVLQKGQPYVGSGPRFQDLEGFGEELADLLFPGTLHDLLGQEPDVYLIIFHDRAAGQIPWELIRIDGAFPALRAGLSRRLLSERPGGGTTRPSGSAARANVLILANPTEDLPETETEAEELEKAIKNRYPEALVTLFHGQGATKERFRKGITSGKYDLIHFAGHGDYDALDPGKSGIYLAGKEVFSSLDLDKPISRPPGLLFISAAEIAQLSGETTQPSLVESFLRAGVNNFISTSWPEGIFSSVEFVRHFYDVLFRGATIGTAMREARLQLWSKKEADCLNYVHFGLPEEIMRLSA